MKHNKLNLTMAICALLIVGLACGSNTPPPAGYVGVWTSPDGTTFTIRADGSADYKSGNSSVNGGGAVIDEAAKTLTITLASMGPTFKIDKAPDGNQMTLDGIIFKKSGGGDTSSTTSDAKPEVPSNDKVQALVKSTFLDFSDSVQSGDFTAFHNKVAKVWRDDSSADQMAEAFKSFVDDKKNYNFKNAVTPMDAVFAPAPAIAKVAGLDALVVKGYYPTKPSPANFDLKYVMDDGSWKLIGMNVDTTKK